MCSVTEGEEDELHVDDGPFAVKCDGLQTTTNEFHKAAECSKCGKKAVVVLRLRDSYCGTCLQASVGHKFRSSLGKSHLMRTGEKVLIAVSGGPSSMTMLHLIKQGLDESSHKRLRFSPTIVYIDESPAMDNQSEDGQRHIKEVKSLVSSYGFDLQVTSIKRANLLNSDELGETTKDEDADHQAHRIHQLFASMACLTSKEDLLIKLRQRILYQVARHFGCSKVFIGDSETRVAVRALSDIAQGKGRHLSLSCGFVDDRYSDVLFLRPMREILLKEIAFYVQVQKIVTIIRPSFTTKHDGSASIQSETEKFVYGLQANFPSTVTTIFRAADKVTKKGPKSPSDNSDSCILCAATIDVVVAENQSITCDMFTGASCSGERSCTNSEVTITNRLRMSDLLPLLCYTCRILVNDMSDISMLPRDTLDSAVARIRRFKMKSDIQDYLLENDV